MWAATTPWRWWKYDGETMYCHDLFGSGSRDLGRSSPPWPGQTEKAVLGFTPSGPEHPAPVRPLMDRDSTLFMLGSRKELLKRYSCRFPLLSHT